MLEMSWHRTSFQDERVVFDPYTTAEAVFVTGGCFMTIAAGCLGIGALAEGEPTFLWGILGLGLTAGLFFFIYSRLKDTVEIEFEKRITSCKRHLGGVLLKNDVTRFEVIHGLVVHSKASRDSRSGPSRWTYGLALVRQDGSLLKLTQEDQSDFEVAEIAAGRLAKRIGCEVLTRP